MSKTRVQIGVLLVACLAGADAASAASVTILNQERHVAARMIVHGQPTTQQFSTDAGSEWKQVAQVVVDSRVRARAVELSTIHDGPGSTTLRSRNRVGIESILDVAETSAVAAGAPHDAYPAAAFEGVDPFQDAADLRLAGSAESWFDVVFRVADSVMFALSVLGDDALADSLSADDRYRVTLSSEDATLFDFSNDLVSGPNGPAHHAGVLTPGDYRFRVFASIAGENILKLPVKVDAKLVLSDLPAGVPSVPTPAAAGLGLAMLMGAVGHRGPRA